MNYVLKQRPTGSRDQGPVSIYLRGVEGSIGRKFQPYLGQFPQVSREHAKYIKSDADALFLQDLNSANGTYVNGERLGKFLKPLNVGDTIGFGTEDASNGLICVLQIENVKQEVIDLSDDEVEPADNSSRNSVHQISMRESEPLCKVESVTNGVPSTSNALHFNKIDDGSVQGSRVTDSHENVTIESGSFSPAKKRVPLVERVQVKACSISLTRCDTERFEWPSDVQNIYNKRNLVETMIDYDDLLGHVKKKKIKRLSSDGSSDDEINLPSGSFNGNQAEEVDEEICYSQVEEVIIISDDESYLDFNSSQNYVHIKEEPPDELDENIYEDDLCREIFFGNESESPEALKIVNRDQMDNVEQIESIRAFLNCSSEQTETKTLDKTCVEAISNYLELECSEESDSSEEDELITLFYDQVPIESKVTENASENVTSKSKDKKFGSFDAVSKESKIVRKSTGRTLLTEPQPLQPRPRKSRGREEGFVERRNYHEASNSCEKADQQERKKQTGKAKKNIKTLPVKIPKKDMPSKPSASSKTLIADPSSNLKKFKIPLKSNIRVHTESSDEKAIPGSSKSAPNLNCPNPVVTKKKAPPVKSRAEGYGSRMQFLFEESVNAVPRKRRETPGRMKSSDDLKGVLKSRTENQSDNSRLTPGTPKSKESKKETLNNIPQDPRKRKKTDPGPTNREKNERCVAKQSNSYPNPTNTLQHTSLQRGGDKHVKNNLLPATSNKASLTHQHKTNSSAARNEAHSSSSVNDLSRRATVFKPNIQTERVASSNRRIELSFFEIVKTILNLRPAWLQEQANLNKPPPQVSEGAADLPLAFQSYDHYVSLFRPMFMLEVWEYMYRESKEIFKSNKLRNNFIYSLLEYTSKNDCIELKCESVVNEEQSYCPQSGFLVVLDISLDSKRCQPFFGYVSRHEIRKLNMDSIKSSRWRSKPKEWLKDAKLWTFHVCIKKKDMSFTLGREMKGNGICFLKNKLRPAEALNYVKHSPLLDSILQPKSSAFLVNYPDALSTREHTSYQMQVIEGICTEIDKPSLEPKIILVQGPPGTGKTHTIIGLLEKLVFYGKSRIKLLVVAPSNAAIDEIGCRIIELNEQCGWRSGIKFVRVGSEAQINKKLIPYFLNNKAKGLHNQMLQTESKLKERDIERLTRDISRFDKETPNYADSEKLRYLREQRKSLQENTEKKLDERTLASYKETLLKDCDIVLSTLNSCAGSIMLQTLGLKSKEQFSCCIIDESTQCTELEVLQPLMFGINKLILFGDHEQLPATVTSNLARQHGFERSLFERLNLCFIKYYRKSPVFTLKEQFRMHSKICQFPSKHFYEEKLNTDPHTDVKYRKFPLNPYIVLDMVNSQESSEASSKFNCAEAEVIVNVCKCLLDVIDTPSSIGIISFYSEQRQLYIAALHQNPRYKDIEINTVDGFQGREKEVIIVSCVRANSQSGGIGFVANRNRLNVAITRAKKCLIVCCHANSMKESSDWRSLIHDARQRKVCIHINSSKDVPMIFEQYIKKNC